MKEYAVVLVLLCAVGYVALDVLWLYLPILAANQMGYVNRFGLLWGRVPVSRRLLGPNKTLGAYYSGPILGLLAMLIVRAAFPQTSLHFGVSWLWVFVAGPAIGLGAVLGDQGNSFLKRRLGIEPESPFPLDRIDAAVGSMIVAIHVLDNLRVVEVFEVIILAGAVHILGNRNSHRRGWRKTAH